MSLTPQSDDRTDAQREYDELHAVAITDMIQGFEHFRQLETLSAALAEGDPRIADHVKVKAAMQSIAVHIKDTAAVTDGVSQSLVDKAAEVSDL